MCNIQGVAGQRAGSDLQRGRGVEPGGRVPGDPAEGDEPGPPGPRSLHPQTVYS